MKIEKFKNLDSIRTIAFFSTFLAHSFDTNSYEVKITNFYKFVESLRAVFSFGVPIFFVLSGFLITYLIIAEYEQKSFFSIKNFYIRRVLRIWPPYYLVLIIGFVFFPIFRSIFLKLPYSETANPWMYLFFLGNFDQIIKNTLPIGVGLGVTWSISVEEQFYLFWPLIFLFLKGKRFIYGITILFIISVILTFIFYFPAKHTIFCVIYLSTGGMLAYLHAYYSELSKKLTSINGVIFLSVLLICFFIMRYHKSIPYSISPLAYIVISFLVGYIILFQIQCKNTYNISNIPGLEYWGKYTYGLYLYHTICNFIIFTIVKYLNIYELVGFFWGDMLLRPISSFILSFILSYYSYQYFELFFLKLKNNFK